MSYSATKTGSVTPFGMELTPDCETGVAWDNFDRYVETSSGKDSLHDTVGIAYQTIDPSIFPASNCNTESHLDHFESDTSTQAETSYVEKEIDDLSSPKRRRRSYESHGLYLVPYRKRPKLDKSSFLNLDDERHKTFETQSYGKEEWQKDVLWMAHFAMDYALTPMWTGWNSQFVTSDQKIQKVWYLPQIKLIEACLTRDIFGTLLCQALKSSVDIAEVLRYPLSPFPLALCHVDGSLQKSPKSALMKHLESRIDSSCPTIVDVTIIDAMFFLHLHQNLPDTYQGLAKYLLKRIMECDGNEIHFVSDKWIEPSIKGTERDKRMTQATCEVYNVICPSQRRPSNWIAALKKLSFKTKLIEFLAEFWGEDSLSCIIGEKVLFVNVGDTCLRYDVVGGMVRKRLAIEYISSHEEADTRMFYHLACIAPPSCVVVRTADTDCLIVALGCMHLYHSTLSIWLEVGLMSNNTLRYINVNELHAKLGETLCKALPLYHALTGCDYTASFCRKGKVQPLRILEKNIAIQQTFAALGHRDLDESTLKTFERFVCCMYSKKCFESVDALRLHIFFEKYQCKTGETKLSFAKKLDSSTMPPCRKVLYQKVKRACFIAKVWMASTLPDPPVAFPEENGWKLVDGRYELLWYEGDPLTDLLNVECSRESFDEDTSDECEIEVEVLCDVSDSDTSGSDED